MKKLLFLLIIIFPISLHAQIRRGGSPLAYKKGTAHVPVHVLPSFDLEKAIREPLEDEDYIRGKKPFKVAWRYEVSLNPSNSGKWTSYGNMDVWRLEIYSENAYALSLLFNKYRLLNDAMLFVYDPSQENVLGGFNNLNNKKSGILPVGFIPGDRLIIELQVKDKYNFGDLELGYVSHAYVDMWGKKDGRFGLSGDCNPNINCGIGEDWQVVKRAVCRIFISENSEFCTGTLINNTALDKHPYLFTANHCIKTTREAESAIFYFGYESPECDDVDGTIDLSLSAAEVLATSDSLDFSLLELSEIPPDEYNPYYAGWTISTQPSINSTCIHHPQGDVKKIAVDYNSLLISYQSHSPPEWLYTGSAPGAFWRVAQWEVGTTEAGSSGSPLFNSAGLIVGNLTGGEAKCSNPVNDYFSKFHKSWDYYPENNRRLKPWLDPVNSGILSLKGLDPFDSIPDPDDMELFQIYPNPSHGQFILETDTFSLKNSQIRIFNINGSLVGKFEPETEKQSTFNLVNLQPGIYIMEIRFTNFTIRKKFIIVK